MPLVCNIKEDDGHIFVTISTRMAVGYTLTRLRNLTLQVDHLPLKEQTELLKGQSLPNLSQENN